ncbi:hypothetical protein BRC60_01675 [Halobacteriales archaeon QH_1_68_42]|nr:MAG: hypothetical protein BRC60_01675 [Halobacteriales archaeon QH_1_68_42]
MSSPSDEGDAAEESVDDVPSVLTQLYRGELDRVTSWRGRLDQTTNWTVTIMAALLTWVFSSPDNPHYLLLIGMLIVMAFHAVESRRYQQYDVWRARVRLIERDVFAGAIEPDGRADREDWRSELSADLRRPALKVPFVEAYARRYRRIYLPLQTVLVVAWAVRLTAFSTDGNPVATAAVVGIPGEVVIAVVGLTYLAMGAVVAWPGERQATGELYERGEKGDWKQ